MDRERGTGRSKAGSIQHETLGRGTKKKKKKNWMTNETIRYLKDRKVYASSEKRRRGEKKTYKEVSKEKEKTGEKRKKRRDEAEGSKEAVAGKRTS